MKTFAHKLIEMLRVHACKKRGCIMEAYPDRKHHCCIKTGNYDKGCHFIMLNGGRTSGKTQKQREMLSKDEAVQLYHKPTTTKRKLSVVDEPPKCRNPWLAENETERKQAQDYWDEKGWVANDPDSI